MINFLSENFFFVGGVVRDYLLLNYSKTEYIGKNHNIQSYKINMENFYHFMAGCIDVDIATTIIPKDTALYLKSFGIHAKRIMGTNSFTLHGTHYDVTSTRIDYDHDGRYAKMKFGASINADSDRRDFTINALYLGTDGTLYDFHNGMDDIKSKTIRFIGDPQTRIKEDYLRIIRCFRFAKSLNLNIEKSTISACFNECDKIFEISQKKRDNEVAKLLLTEKICQL